jgi:hypothetical protein
MATWPSGTKASATTTAADSNSISGARGDINQSITNQNAIIDTFNIGTPGASEDNKILVYDNSTGKFEIEANTSSQTPFAQEVDQNGFMLKDDSRNYQILGNTASPSSADFDSFSNTNRVHGVVNVNKVTNPASRVHSNPRLSMVVAGADAAASGPTANIGRLRQNYVEGIYDMAGFDNLTTGFGKGHNGMFVSGLLTNSTTTTSNLTESSAITITAQIDTVDANPILVTDMAGLEVQGYCNGVGSSATNFYGFYYNAPSGDEAANLGTTSHYSFYGADANATLYNAGPLEAKGLKYPTSDGSANQVIKTDGSGNLSFVDQASGGGGSFGSVYDLGTILSTDSTLAIDYSNGSIQKGVVTAASGTGSTFLQAPTNMSDGDVLFLIFDTTGTVGQTADIQYATGVGYITDSAFVMSTNQGSSALVRIIKQGSNLYGTRIASALDSR